jgi:microcystin degradation protein MlrC
MAKRVGVASIIQETNTFSANQSTMQDFEIQGIWLGADVVAKSQGLNIEVAGSLERLHRHGLEAIPLVRAWAMSGGVLLDTELAKLKTLLKQEISAAGSLDGLILNGNPSRRIIAASSALIGFRTYPHIDQGDTGRRAADLMNELLSNNRRLGTVMKKLNMIIPAETMGTSDQPLLQIRELADSLIDDEILDISLFPVQPWIDVSEVGFGITVVHAGDIERANECAEIIRNALWKVHKEFQATLYSVEEAIGHAIKDYQGKLQVLAQSSDAPTGGSTGDDSRVVAALVNYGSDIPSACTVVDAPAVDRAYSKSIGDDVLLSLGFKIDPRWGSPVTVSAKLVNKGDAPVVLTGPAMTGQVVSIGRWVVLESSNKVKILVSESGTTTFDPAGYEIAGIDLDECVIVHVRSPLLFKSGFAGRYGDAFSLDLDGPTTPNIKKLKFSRVPRPMIGLDEFDGELAEVSSD